MLHKLLSKIFSKGKQNNIESSMNRDFNQEEYVFDFLNDARGGLKKSDFQEFVKGKKIIIVGPSQDQSNIAQHINVDSYDLVVRCNTALEHMPYDKELSKEMGTRIDIVYLSPSCERDYLGSSNPLLEKMWPFFNDKLSFIRIVGKPKSSSSIDIETYNNDFLSNGIKIPFFHDHYLYDYLASQLAALQGSDINADKHIIPRVGFFALFELLCLGAESVTVKNMTFYHGGTNIFRDNCVDNFTPTSRHDGKDSRHDSELEIKILLDLIKKNKNKILYDHLLENTLLKYSQLSNDGK